jgi:hypothetical protein
VDVVSEFILVTICNHSDSLAVEDMQTQ